jgi:hypothetical protein
MKGSLKLDLPNMYYWEGKKVLIIAPALGTRGKRLLCQVLRHVVSHADDKVVLFCNQERYKRSVRLIAVGSSIGLMCIAPSTGNYCIICMRKEKEIPELITMLMVLESKD